MPAFTLPFYKLSPGGNPTILIRDNSLFDPEASTAATRAAIARALMDPGHLGAEQVGFLDTSRSLPHMEMMGGEFCVNATRCAAFVFASLGLLPGGDAPGTWEGSITASGTAEPVRVRVGKGVEEPDGTLLQAAIALPLPGNAVNSLVRASAPGETIVRLPGITHVLLNTALHPLPGSPLPQNIVDAAAAKRTEHGLDAEEAAGVIWHSAGPGNAVTILPVVHVAATGSSIVETACGSGSLAVALLLAQKGGTDFTIRQPSGHDIIISLEHPSRLPEPLAKPLPAPLLAWINGPVRLTAEGNAYVTIPATSFS